MNESYLISVTGTQTGGGMRDQQSFSVPCALTDRNGVYYLTYTEPSGRVRVTLKMQRDRAVMLRADGPTRMVFHPGRTERCDYVTEAGIIPMEILTHSMSVHITASGGDAQLRYALYTGGTLLSENEIEIRLRPADI